METILIKNQNMQKPELSLTANSVKKYLGTLEQSMQKRKDTTVLQNAMQTTEKKIGNQKNRCLGEEGLVLMKHIDDGLRKILNVWHTSKPGDMLEKKMQKVRTHLKNGKSCAKSLITNVLNVGNLKSLQKTISNHYQKGEATIFQTYNLFVGIVTVESGKLTSTKTQNYLTKHNT